MKTNMYYFGCNHGYGHGLITHPQRNGVQYDELPWWKNEGIDGTLCHQGIAQEEGIAKLHHKYGWTALAFWDRSIDHRRGSNSVFLAEGTFTFEEMLSKIESFFPKILKRFSFSIILKE